MTTYSSRRSVVVAQNLLERSVVDLMYYCMCDTVQTHDYGESRYGVCWCTSCLWQFTQRHNTLLIPNIPTWTPFQPPQCRYSRYAQPPSVSRWSLAARATGMMAGNKAFVQGATRRVAKIRRTIQLLVTSSDQRPTSSFKDLQVASLLLVAMPGAPSSFLLLLVRHLLLEAMHLFLASERS